MNILEVTYIFFSIIMAWKMSDNLTVSKKTIKRYGSVGVTIIYLFAGIFFFFFWWIPLAERLLFLYKKWEKKK